MPGLQLPAVLFLALLSTWQVDKSAENRSEALATRTRHRRPRGDAGARV